MVLFNYALKELTAKIVYYGPGLSGKTTNLKYIHEELPIKSKGRMLTLATETDRTLYFDFLPVDAGIVRGIKTRIQLYTVPGQVFYNATRRMVLKGADGVVFVADSQKDMMEANLESLDNLRENLAAHDLRLDEIPLVMQYNKRDLEDALSIEEMNETLNTLNAPFYAAVATDGIGVEDTLKAVSSLVMKSVTDKYGAAEKRGAPKEHPFPPRRDAPVVSREESIRLNEKTDPFAAPLAVQAAAGAGAEIFAPTQWTAESVTDPFDIEEPEEEEDFALGGRSRGESGRSADHVEPDMKPDESEEFDSLNLEGILDEALRVEEEAAEDSAEDSGEEASFLDTSFEDEDAGLGSGAPAQILDDALGLDEESQSPLARPRPGARSFSEDPLTADEPSLGPDASPFGKEELDLLEDRFSQLDSSPNVERSLDELARTQMADDIESMLQLSTPEIKRETTSPEVHVSRDVEAVIETEAHEVEVPVHLSISPETEEIELKVTLRIKIDRKKNG